MSFFLIGLLVLAAAAGGFYFWAQRQWPPTGYGRDRGQPTPTGMYLDQQSGLMLPQGTQLATPGRRIGAFFLAIPLVIITLGIGYLIWGLIVWPNGQTPALQVLGMRCFRPEDNRVAGFWWMALREIVAGFSEGTTCLRQHPRRRAVTQRSRPPAGRPPHTTRAGRGPGRALQRTQYRPDAPPRS